MAPGSATLRGALAALSALLALTAAPAAQASVNVQHVAATGAETLAVSNDDGILAPGETFSLTERIRNAETSALHNVHGSLSFTDAPIVVEAIGDPLVTLTETESDYGTLAPDAQANNL